MLSAGARTGRPDLRQGEFSWSVFGDDPFHGHTLFAEILVGGWALAFFAVIATAGFAVGEIFCWFFTDLAFFFVAHIHSFVVVCLIISQEENKMEDQNPGQGAMSEGVFDYRGDC